MKLLTKNYGGNLHDAADAINKEGLAEHVLTMECITGRVTVAVFRVPDEFEFAHEPTFTLSPPTKQES